MKTLIPLFFLLLITGCAESQKMEMKNDGTTSCQLIEKNFVKKNGKEMESTDLYLRCSMQDYFIKVCESDVSHEELMKHLNEGITVKMEIREGLWDHCDDEPMVQSRSGEYVVIHSIEK